MESRYRCGLQVRRLGHPKFHAQVQVISLAGRRIAIQPSHRQFAYIAFKSEGNVFIVGHKVFMFGAISAVHAWERIGGNVLHKRACFRHVHVFCYTGELVKAIGRRYLHLPLLRQETYCSNSLCNLCTRVVIRYVDDYFAAEHEGYADKAMNIFARCEHLV